MKIGLHIILCLKWFMKIGGNDLKLKDSPEILLSCPTTKKTH